MQPTTESSPSAHSSSSPAARFLPLLFLLFFLSGCAALMYEVVWYQMLQLAVGSTSVSMGVLLATFMGGLCIGSLGLPRLKVASTIHPLRLYAMIEVGIAIYGVLVAVLMPYISHAYFAVVGDGLPNFLM